MEQRTRQNCVYILKTGKNLYKIGKTRDLQKRLATYLGATRIANSS